MLTGLLGNLTLLSYFAKKREKEAILVQTLGVVSIYVVIAQLAIAGAMPALEFAVTSATVAAGLALNFMNYNGWLLDWIWRIWEDFIIIAGLSVLPQIIWKTFVPFIPNSLLPGLISCTLAVLAVILFPKRYTGTDWQTSTEDSEHCWVCICMDCHSTIHVDAYFSDVDKLSKS
ncbi:Maltose excess protein 1-like, chloroplastic [Apostasia shenzhenica]|uniref:Maltose excess protein 1-like, chloroplastic n=1 Tax=Apostasia shenzhenica TaxID=1088818 RepID=A0A2H9ZSC0_9ASPA|nr:Maltose excess protein 1-like, chloroplastic [Apostasia shenzhenica]